VPGWLDGLPGVTSLQLQHNYIQDLPDGAHCCGLPTALQYLDLTDNRLREVPGSIALLRCLHVCVLDGNYLTSLPCSIWDLPALQELSVQENMLGSLPECSRPVVTHSCCEAVWGEMPKGMAGSSSSSRSARLPGSAAVLAIAGVGFAEADQNVGPSAHQDTRAGSGFEGLTAEEEDLLSAVGVVRSSSALVPSLAYDASAPAPFAAGVAVVAVRKGSHQQQCVQHGHDVPLQQPAACADSLRSLVLSGNQLSDVPASISQLINLRRLDLCKNQLRALPDSSGLWGCTRLTQLQLADNHLQQLPAGLSQLQHLQQLDVSGNHLAVHIQRDASRAAPAAASATTAVAERTSYGWYCSASGSPSSCSVAQASHTVAGRCGPAAHCPGVVTVLLEAPAATPHVLAHNSSRSTAVRRPVGSLPCPLRNLPALQQLHLGRQQVEESTRCPLQLLLGGLGILAERVKCLAPQSHQCPVTKAAAAAVAHLTGVTSARRARALEQQQQQQLADTHIQGELQGEAMLGASRKRVCMDA
jgi:Leucine-rich repeat (LRR) protein